MSGCRKCHHLSYVNQHKLDTANKLRISYQAPEVIGTLSYPRRYTIGTDDYEEFVVSIGTEYHPERHKYIIHGEWLIKESPEILFVFALDAGSAAQVNFFNVVTCNRVSLVLEAVAFAEIALLARYPRLQATPILIAFVCSDEDLQRRETWNTLGDWLPTTFEQKKKVSLYLFVVTHTLTFLFVVTHTLTFLFVVTHTLTFLFVVTHTLTFLFVKHLLSFVIVKQPLIDQWLFYFSCEEERNKLDILGREYKYNRERKTLDLSRSLLEHGR